MSKNSDDSKHFICRGLTDICSMTLLNFRNYREEDIVRYERATWLRESSTSKKCIEDTDNNCIIES